MLPPMDSASWQDALRFLPWLVAALLVLYLVLLNRLLSSTPEAVRRLTAPERWTAERLRDTYRRLEKEPITPESCAAQLPPKLERRYVVTGGSGLVGGYIVLQLLARGHPPEAIRIVDFRKPYRPDMLAGPAAAVPFVPADIASAEATDAAFRAPWPPAVARLPLTVFHTAAVIVASERYRATAGFCDAVNVRGTQNVVDAARRAGADVLVSTTSGSISIRPVGLWVPFWRLFRGGSTTRSSSSWPRGFWQVLDEADFFRPLRPHRDFFANYPASKAAAERIVCAADAPGFRTGCIRPANGVYGNATDNTVGGALAKSVLPTWVSHIVQSFVHGMNVAVAHLQLEAVLASATASPSLPQAGRPFVVTDPNPPIRYDDLYFLLRTLAATPFRTVRVPPVLLLLVSYPVEWYGVLLARFPWLRRRLRLPPLSGDIRHLQPGLFSITTHLVATNATAGAPVGRGGLGYRGLITTLEGMVQEVVEWNREHAEGAAGPAKVYKTSIDAAEEIQKLRMMASVAA